MNNKLTPKDRNVIKGAVRRAFSRSGLRKEVLELSRVEHHDPERPRVTKWSRCQKCQALTPTYKMEVHHIEPVVPVDRLFEDMSMDEFIDRLWCDKNNLTAICPMCHDRITREEKALRKLNKEKNKNEQSGKGPKTPAKRHCKRRAPRSIK